MRVDWLLLIGFLVGSSFVYGGIMTIIMIMMVIFYLVDPFSSQKNLLFPGIGFFIVIILVGLLGSPRGKDPYDIAKDVWYVSNAVLPILIGYLMMRRMNDLKQVLRAFVTASAIVAVVHILQFVRNPSYLTESFVDIRSQVSPGYYITVLGIAIIFGDIKFKLGLLKTRPTSWGVVSLCLLSVVFSFSRTLWVILLTAAGVVIIAGNVKKVALSSIMLAYIVVITLWAVGPDIGRFSEGGTSFIDKIVNSVAELKVSEYTSMTDINQYWRGFESYRAFQTYASGSAVEYLVGQGFGTSVDLGFVMTLAEEEFDRLPVLHNGYLYLLVKTGAVGLAAYLLFLLLTFRRGIQLTRLPDSEAHFCGLMLVALTLVVLETTLVISGLFSKAALSQTSLLIGMLLRYAEVHLMSSDKKVSPLSRNLLEGWHG